MLSTEEDRVEEREYAGEVDLDGETRDDSREKSSSVLSRESASERGILSSLPQLRRRSMDGERTVLGGSSGDCACTTMAGGVGGSLRIVSVADPRSIVWARCAGSIGRICGRTGDFPFSSNVVGESDIS